MNARRAAAVASSWCASAARLGAGMSVRPLGPRPTELLEVWEFEACPYSRRVREAMSELDLDALVHPCPRGGTRYRPQVKARGRRMFPLLRDPGRDVEMDESADIVAYLYEHYGAGPIPALSTGALSIATSAIASGMRGLAGRAAWPSRAADEPLELWGFEASPYVRIVREVLCSLELRHVSHPVAKGSPGRDAFVARSGKMQVPYLVDPNTGVAMFESAEIADYLVARYGV